MTMKSQAFPLILPVFLFCWLLSAWTPLLAQEKPAPNELDYLFPFCYSLSREDYQGLPSGFTSAYKSASARLTPLLDRPQTAQLEKVIEQLTKARELAGKNLQARALAANRLALAYFALSKAQRRTEPLRRAEDTLQNALTDARGEELPRTYHNLGFIHLDLAYKTEMTRHLKLALENLNRAAQDPKWRKNRLDYGKTQYLLGTLYSQLYHLENPVENLKKSIAHFKTAMEIFKACQTKTPGDDLKYSIGYAYGMLFMLGKNPEDFEKSISYYDNVLKLMKTQEKLPASYAETLEALGNIYVSASEVKNPEKNLNKAIYCLEKARQICDAKNQPEVYTQIYWDLGFAYYHLAEVKRPRENLEKALSLYRQALKDRDLEKEFTYDYVEYLFNLGSAYSALYQFDGREENRAAALKWLNRALALAKKHGYDHDIAPITEAIDQLQEKGGHDER